MNRIKLVLWLLCIARTGGDCHTIWGHTAALILTVDREGWCDGIVYPQCLKNSMHPSTRCQYQPFASNWAAWKHVIPTSNSIRKWQRFLQLLANSCQYFDRPKSNEKAGVHHCFNSKIGRTRKKNNGWRPDINRNPPNPPNTSAPSFFPWYYPADCMPLCPVQCSIHPRFADLLAKRIHHSQPSVVAEEHHSGSHGIEEGIRQAWANRKLWMGPFEQNKVVEFDSTSSKISTSRTSKTREVYNCYFLFRNCNGCKVSLAACTLTSVPNMLRSIMSISCLYYFNIMR